MTRCARLLLCILLLDLACGPGGDPSSPSDPAIPCDSDTDCDGELALRACRDGRCTDVCGQGYTYVAPGAFTRGCDADENTAETTVCGKSAQPAHEVRLSAGFCLSRTELTVGQYRACVAAGRCPASDDLRCTAAATWTAQAGAAEDLPVSCLLWPEAQAACEFLGGSLPTEAQWEKAARGGDRRAYPWGDTAPMECARGVNWGAGGGCPGAPWAAGSSKGPQALSAAMASDMAGNLWEWVADFWSPSAYASCQGGCADPTGPDTGILRVRRGGSYQSLPIELRASFREFHLPDMARSDMIGARCARGL